MHCVSCIGRLKLTQLQLDERSLLMHSGLDCVAGCRTYSFTVRKNQRLRHIAAYLELLLIKKTVLKQSKVSVRQHAPLYIIRDAFKGSCRC